MKGSPKMEDDRTAVEMVDDVADELRERGEEVQAQVLQGCCDAIYADEPVEHLMKGDTAYQVIFVAVRKIAIERGFIVAVIGDDDS